MKLTLTDKNGNQVLAVESYKTKTLSDDERLALYNSDKYKKSKAVLNQIYKYLKNKCEHLLLFPAVLKGPNGNIKLERIFVDYNGYPSCPVDVSVLCDFSDYNAKQKSLNAKCDWPNYLKENFNRFPASLVKNINNSINDVINKFKPELYGIKIRNAFANNNFSYSWYGWEGKMKFYWVDVRIDETSKIFSSDISVKNNDTDKKINDILCLPEIKRLISFNNKEIFSTKFANTNNISVKYSFYKADLEESIREGDKCITVGQLQYTCANDDDYGAFDDFDVFGPAFKALCQKINPQKLKLELDDYSDDETVYILASSK